MDGLVKMANTFIHEEKYRGAEILKKIADCSLTICGAGAIGSNLVDNMIRQGFKKFSVIDKDRVEDHNRNNQLWGRRDVGMLKVTALKSYAFNALGVVIEDISKELNKENVHKLLKKNTLVIDGFDNPPSRRIVTEYCRANNIECLHIGLYQDTAEVTWNKIYRIPDEVVGLDVCEYPLARNIAMLSVIIGTESILRFLKSKVQESFLITLKDFKITKR
jgi:molybdopterin/thiamine biosynthesis adenylyltransferase